MNWHDFQFPAYLKIVPEEWGVVLWAGKTRIHKWDRAGNTPYQDGELGVIMESEKFGDSIHESFT